MAGDDLTRKLFYRIKRLGRSATVLHIGAHPDDEEAGLLATVAYKYYGRPIFWSATRGEKGQNRINHYQSEALGVFRTWESLAAREIDGGECLFGPFMDFGFCKNADHAFAKWNKEALIKELVLAIRMTQPLVIVSRWEGSLQDGHGQHQAVGQALREAIELADAFEYFPELMDNGYAPWRPRKVYVCKGKEILSEGRLKKNLERKGILRINTGEYNTIIGRTYQEQAGLAINRHQTQGLNVLPSPGDFYCYLERLKSEVEVSDDEADIFEGLDIGLAGLVSGFSRVPEFLLKGLAKVEAKVEEALLLFNPEIPSPAAGPLLDGLKELKTLCDQVDREEFPSSGKPAITTALKCRMSAFEEVIAATLGLRFESACTRGKVTPGESVWVTNRLWNFGRLSIDEVSFAIRRPENWQVSDKEEDIVIQPMPDGYLMIQEIFIGTEADPSCPYWLRKERNGAAYDLSEELFRSPFSPPPLTGDCRITFGPHTIRLSAPTLHRKSFHGGYRELPLTVVPPISLHPVFDKTFVLSQDIKQKIVLKVVARCNDEERPAKGRLTLQSLPDWQIAPSFFDITLPQVDGAQTCTFEVTVPPGSKEGRYELMFTINCRDRDYGVVMTPVRRGSPGLPLPDDAATCQKEEFLLRPSRVTVHVIQARPVEGRRLAYIEGTKEEILATLKPLGLPFQPLTDVEIAHADLEQYKAIVVGPNAYLIRSTVKENAHRLLDYLRNGGTLIVQFHWPAYQTGLLTPYPVKYHIPHDRVSDKDAPVTILEPDDPVFTFPNLITEDDFHNWVHDRGLYFWGEWDERYLPLLSSADSGEPPKRGGLVKCRFGRGQYFYVGYSLFRQIPEGVPGAFKLFFNLLFSSPDEKA